MNNGFFGFPSSLDSSVIDIKEFDISGAYTIPPNTKRLIIFAVGGGGGGAGGIRLVGNGCSGGSGGNSANFVLSEIDKKSLNGITILNIIIGAGGSGGAGSASNGAAASNGGGGGATTIGISGKKNPFISAAGSQYGLAGSTVFGQTSQAGSGISAGISLMFGSVVFGEFGIGPPNVPTFYTGINTAHPILTTANDGIGGKSGRGTTDSVGGTVHVFSPLSCGGAGGGGVSYTTTPGTAFAGGGIKFMNASGADFSTSATTYKPIFSSCLSGDYSPGDVVYSGGAINTATAPINSNQMICPDCMFSAGFGGAGGGGGASTSANNGANGYRGGGGGGGGGSKNVAAGNGGAGGNGYVKIVAIG